MKSNTCKQKKCLPPCQLMKNNRVERDFFGLYWLCMKLTKLLCINPCILIIPTAMIFSSWELIAQSCSCWLVEGQFLTGPVWSKWPEVSSTGPGYKVSAIWIQLSSKASPGWLSFEATIFSSQEPPCPASNRCWSSRQDSRCWTRSSAQSINCEDQVAREAYPSIR